MARGSIPPACTQRNRQLHVAMTEPAATPATQRQPRPLRQKGNDHAWQTWASSLPADCQCGQAYRDQRVHIKVKVRHARIISHGPKPVPEYMQLPVDEYALYDPRIMKRVPADEAAADGTEGAIFELALPTMRPAPGTFAPRPKFRVRVTAQQDELRIESISATLFDDYDETAGVALPPNMTAPEGSESKARRAGRALFQRRWSGLRQRGDLRRIYRTRDDDIS